MIRNFTPRQRFPCLKAIRSLTTSPAIISPATDGTKAVMLSHIRKIVNRIFKILFHLIGNADKEQHDGNLCQHAYCRCRRRRRGGAEQRDRHNHSKLKEVRRSSHSRRRYDFVRQLQ